ncbi:MAG: class I SAM-dependent methyltransferase [Deltaproteobacteria bacterium]
MQDKASEKKFYNDMFSKSHGDGHFIAHGYDEIYRKTVDRVDGGLALDVGCGTGKHSVNLSKKGFRTVAIELSFNGVLAAKANAEREKAKVHFVVGDVENMPFKDRSFDVLFCGLLLHHFPDLTALSKELTRVGKSYLFALETNALEPVTFLKFNVVNPLLKPGFMTPNQRALFPDNVRRVFEREGFSGFEFSWIDIHVPYKGIIRLLTKAFTSLTAVLPVKYRCNKFVMSCRKVG